jgi:hypothetical protein
VAIRWIYIKPAESGRRPVETLAEANRNIVNEG